MQFDTRYSQISDLTERIINHIWMEDSFIAGGCYGEFPITFQASFATGRGLNADKRLFENVVMPSYVFKEFMRLTNVANYGYDDGVGVVTYQLMHLPDFDMCSFAKTALLTKEYFNLFAYNNYGMHARIEVCLNQIHSLINQYPMIYLDLLRNMGVDLHANVSLEFIINQYDRWHHDA